MRLRLLTAVVCTEVRILAVDRGIVVPLVAPWVAVVFLKPIYELHLRTENGDPSQGIRIAAAGVAVAWLYFLLGHVAAAFFREYMWGTWRRIRISGLRPVEIVLGKTLPLFGLGVIHQCSVFLLAKVAMGMETPRNLPLLALSMSVYSAALALFGVALVGVFKTMRRILFVQSIAIMIFGGIGGSLTPLELLPPWMQTFARLLPNYWAGQLYRGALGVDGYPVTSLTAWLALGLFSVVAAVVAVSRFSVEASEKPWV